MHPLANTRLPATSGTRLPRWLLLIPLLLLTACVPSQQQMLRARHTVAASIDRSLTCHRIDHCAQASALYQLGPSANDDGNNQAIILDLGEDALIARLNLIRAAHRSISVQTYIWAFDDAGNLLLDELVQAARRGVRVRILADQLQSFPDIEQLARLARTHRNLEVRLYNPTLNSAVTGIFGYVVGGVCCFSSINQRMHNKLFVVDGQIGITGGRNYQNQYFDWDNNFNFIDRDVLIGGPVVKDMQDSFERFWDQPRSVPVLHLSDINARIIQDGPGASGWQSPDYEHPERVARVLRNAADPDYLRSHFLLRSHRLDQARFFSDRPGKTESGDFEDRKLTAHLMQMLATAREEIVLQTPYLVISDQAQDIFRMLARKRPRMRILISTNSLASTDAFMVYALSHKYVRRYLTKLNFNIYEQKPHPVDAPRMIANFHQASGEGGARGSNDRYSKVPLTTGGMRISLHAKSMVVDHRFVMIGSHNFDPRSDDYNTECGLIINDPDFARVVRASILANIRPGNSWVVAPRQAQGMLGKVNRMLANLSAAMPIFDLWPFGYATSWQLKADPDCRPMLHSNPRFYECHVPVGEFPEVALPLKTIYTRIITAFGSSFRGML